MRELTKIVSAGPVQGSHKPTQSLTWGPPHSTKSQFSWGKDIKHNLIMYDNESYAI